ncbi:MAG: HAD family phosphatase [Chitinophagaceae bacterium]|nr:HAD family phosphatase [Chitinophagaceae bacterium]
MSQIKNIIFDLGGVLLNLDLAKTRQEFFDLGLTQIDELFRIGHAASFFKQYEIGAISDQEFVDEIKKELKVSVPDQQIVHAWNAMLLDFPSKRVEWLKKQRQQFRIFLFSNTNALHLIEFRKSFREAHGFEIDELFEKAYYSHEAQIRKPDAGAYQLVIDENGLEAAHTLFIDDALINVEAALSVGLQAFHLKPGEELALLHFG